MVKRRSEIISKEEWLEVLSNERSARDLELLQKAMQLLSPLPSDYTDKGYAIANILYYLGLDTETLCAALLYPALQDEKLTTDNIIEVLGAECSDLLRDVIQLKSLKNLHALHLNTEQQIENLRKMLLAMVTDVRAVLIVLAERLWQLHEFKNAPEKERKAFAQETLDIFAPLANRLGVWQLKWEIEDLSLRYIEPETYTKIAKWLASKREEREAYLAKMQAEVEQVLLRAHVASFQLSGRVKHIYSIYKKMLRKNVSIDEIYDVSALRILVPTIDDCYAVLSVLQDNWPQVLHEFDDYISQPKPNGYQSIHTVLIGAMNRYIEVQIRTYQMHQESELGVASHWQYKEGILQTASYEAKIALLRQLIAWQKEITKEAASKEQVMQDLFADRVYVFTPLGDIIDLAKGATPLDFAYHIHSEVGHRCRGAKINGNIVPITYQLQTGDRVEILTAKHAAPSRDWLNPQLGYIKTPRSRAKVAHWFRLHDEKANTQNGRELLEKELKKRSSDEKIDHLKIAQKFNLKSTDELYRAIATGEVRLSQIANLRRPQLKNEILPIRQPSETASSRIQISGVDNLLTQIARCCKPLPGDEIVGYITRARGVSIHRADCTNIEKFRSNHLERLVEVQWGQKAGSKYPVDLSITAQDRSGLLRDITTLLAAEKINLLAVQTHQLSEQVEIFLTVEMDNREMLARFIELLKKIESIQAIRRR